VKEGLVNLYEKHEEISRLQSTEQVKIEIPDKLEKNPNESHQKNFFFCFPSYFFISTFYYCYTGGTL
jgi:hypothetical protein